MVINITIFDKKNTEKIFMIKLNLVCLITGKCVYFFVL